MIDDRYEPDMKGCARIVIVEPQEIMRIGLRAIFSGEPDMRIVGESRDLERGRWICQQLRPDVVLFGWSASTAGGAHFIESIVERTSKTHVVVMDTDESPHRLFEALRAGARGYLWKCSTSEDLVDGVRRVLAGECVAPFAAAGRILHAVSHPRVPRSVPFASLTERERDVLSLVAEGLTNQEIALRLNLSLSTIKTHLVHSLSKLGASDRAQAAVRAITLGLLERDPGGLFVEEAALPRPQRRRAS